MADLDFRARSPVRRRERSRARSEIVQGELGQVDPDIAGGYFGNPGAARRAARAAA